LVGSKTFFFGLKIGLIPFLKWAIWDWVLSVRVLVLGQAKSKPMIDWKGIDKESFRSN
jgi:hypothetical protein